MCCLEPAAADQLVHAVGDMPTQETAVLLDQRS